MLKRFYRWFRKVCKILSKEFKTFRYIEKKFEEIDKTIRLLKYTQEWLNKKKFQFTIVKGIKYPTIETIINLHDFLVEQYEHDIDKIHKGNYSLSGLDFEGIKYWVEKNPDNFEDIVLRGAHIFNLFLEEGHPFVDGNKRTGWESHDCV